MNYPVLEKYPVTQDFGITEYSQKKKDEIYSFFNGKHPGLDFAMPIGEPVFAYLPEFGEGVPKQFKETFTYDVNHNHSLIDLAIKFFGSEEGVSILRMANPDLGGVHSHEVLNKGTKIVVSLK